MFGRPKHAHLARGKVGLVNFVRHLCLYVFIFQPQLLKRVLSLFLIILKGGERFLVTQTRSPPPFSTMYFGHPNMFHSVLYSTM
jgi:hypothetical protein